ncbi:MAG: hypothetical protein HY720_22550 [Planctomycetes bacterium]|nr:hypothetical protein [Planctomycetota bacterium]
MRGRKNFAPVRALLLAAFLAAAFAPAAHAANVFNWDGGGDNVSWEDANNWDNVPLGYPSDSADTANINTAAAQASGTIQLASSITINSFAIAPLVTLSLGSSDLTVTKNITLTDLGNGTARVTGSGRFITGRDNGTLTTQDAVNGNDKIEIDVFEIDDSGGAKTWALAARGDLRVMKQFFYTSSAGVTINTPGRFAIPGGSIPAGNNITTAGGLGATIELSGAFQVNGTLTLVAADTLLVTAYANATSSIDAGTNPTALQKVEIASGATLAPTVDLTVNANWTVRNGGTFTGGTRTVTFPIANTLTVEAGGTCQFNNLTVSNTTTLAAGSNFATTGTLQIAGGATLTASGVTANVITIDGGTFTRTGTFNPGISRVAFAGATPTMPSTVTTFYDLEIAATTSTSAAANYTILNDWIATTGNFTAGSFTVTFDGTGCDYVGTVRTTFNAVVIDGSAGTEVFTLDTGDLVRVSTLTAAYAGVLAGGKLALSGNATLEVSTSLIVNGSLTATGQTPTIRDTGAYFAFTVAGGAGRTFNIDRAAIRNVNDTGLQVNSLPATLFNIDNAIFTNDDGAATGTYLNINFAIPALPRIFSGCSFDANCQYSVRTLAGSGANAINMQGAGGAKGLETYENDVDSGVVSPGSIVWNRKLWTNGTGDGLWGTGGNWSPPGAPGSAEAVVIPDNASHVPAGGPTINNAASPATIGSLLVEDGGTVVTTGNNPTFTVNGTTTIETDLGAGSPGSFDFRGTGALTLSGLVTAGGTLIVGNTGAVAFGENLVVSSGATFTLKNGPASVTVSGSISNQGTLDLADGGNPDYAGNATVTGNFTNGSSATFLSGTASTFVFSGTLGTIDAGGDSFRGVTISGASTYEATTDLAVTGLLDCNGALRVRAALSMTGSFDGTAGTIDFAGSAAQTVPAPPGGAPYFNLTISNTSGTGATLGASFPVAGTLLVQSGSTLSGGTATLTLSGTWDNRGTFTAGGSTLATSGTPTIAGTVVTTFGNVTISAGTTLSVVSIAKFRVAGTWTNNHATDGFNETGTTVEFTGSPSTIAGALVTTFNNLTIASGSLGLSGVTTVRVRNVWTNNGSYTPGTTTVVFAAVVAGDLGQIAGTSPTTFYNLDLANLGANPSLLLDGTDDITVSQLLTIQANETLRLEGPVFLRLGTGIVVDGAGAKFSATFTGNKPTVTDTGAYFSFKVRGGGTVDFGGCVFQNPDNSGLDIEATASITIDFDAVDFRNADGAATGTYVTIRFAAIPANRYTFSSCTFDTNCQFNVTVPVDTGADNAISMTGWSGAKGGEDFDSDPRDPTPSIVEWPEKVWDGSTSISWMIADNWTPINNPSPTDRVLVDFFKIPPYANPPGNTPQYDQGGAGETIAALYIADGSAMTSKNGKRLMIITGDFTIEPDLGAGSRGRLTWKGQSDTKKGGFEVGGTMTNDGNFLVEEANPLIVVFRGQFLNRGTFDNQNSGAGFAQLTATAGGLTIQGDLDNRGSFEPFANQGTAERVEVRGSWLNSVGGTFLTELQDAGDQVVLSGGSDASPKTIQSNGQAFINLLIPAGAVYRATDSLVIGTAAQAGRLRVDGKLIVVGALTFVNAATVFETGTGTIEFAGASPQTIPVPPNGAGGSNPYFNLAVSNTNAAGATLGGDITVNGALTIKSGGKLAGSTRTLTLVGDWTNDGTFSAGTSTVSFFSAAASTSTVRGSVITPFYNVTISATKTLALSTATTPANAMRVGGIWTNGGTFTPGSSTVFFSGGASQIAGAVVTTYNHLTIDSGATLSVGAIQIANLNGTWTNDGTFSAGNSIVRFTGSGGGIAGLNPTTFNVVQVQSGGTLTLSAGDNITVTGTNLPAAPDNVGFLVRAGGTVSLVGSATLRLGQGISIGRSATPGGTFLASGSTPTVTDTGTSYAFDVFGGTVDIDALNLDGLNSNGLRVNDSANYAFDIDNVDFTDGNAAVGFYVNLRYTAISGGQFTFSGCTFDANCLRNVHTEAGIADAAVTLTGASGAKGTKDYEDDRGAGQSSPPNGDTTGSIRWASFRWTNGTGNRLWSEAGNWDPAGPPPATASVLIPDLSTLDPGPPVDKRFGPILNLTTTIGSLTLEDNSTFQTDGGARSLTVNGPLILQNLGTPAAFSFAGSGNLAVVAGVLDAGGSVTWSSTGTCRFDLNVTIAAGGAFLVSNGPNAGDVRIGGSLTNNGTLDFDDGGNPDYDGTFRVVGSWTNGALAIFASGSLSTVALGDTAGFGSSTLQSAGDAFRSLRVETNYTYSATDALVANGILDINGRLNVATSVTMAGTFDAATGVVAYTGTADQSVVVPPGGAYYDLVAANTGAAVATLAGNLSARNVTIDADGDLAAGATTLTLSGDLTNNGNFQGGTSTFRPNGAPTTVRGSSTTTFNAIVIQPGATLAVSTATAPANHIRLTGNWDNHGAFTQGTSTVTFLGNPSTIDAITATTDNVTTFNHLVIAAGASVDVNDAPGAIGQIQVQGTVTNSSGGTGFVAGTHTVRFLGASGALAGNAITIETVAFGASAQLTLDGTDDLRVNTLLTIPSGATLRLDGTAILRLATGITVNGSLIAVAGTTQTITDTGTKFGFTVNLSAGGDTLDLDNLSVTNPNASGLRVLATSTFAIDVDGVTFTGGTPVGGIYLDLQYAAIPANTFTFSGCSFDVDCQYNVKTQAGASDSAVNMTGFSGAKGDQLFENDKNSGGPIDPGSITWQVIRWDNGSAAGNRLWSDPTNWNPDGVPPANARIIIPADTAPPLVNPGGPILNLSTTVGSMLVESGGTVTNDATSGRVLTVSGDVTIQNVATAGSVAFTANARISIGGSLVADGTFSHATANLLVSGNVTVGVGGSFTSSGTGAVVGVSFTNAGTANLNTGTIRVEGNFSNTGTFLPTSGTVSLGKTVGAGSGTLALGGGRFFNLKILANYSYSATGAVTIGDGAGGSLDVDGTLSLATSISFGAGSTFDSTAGKIAYAGSAAQVVVVPPGGLYFDLEIANTGAAVATPAGALSVSTFTILSDGEYSAGATTLTVRLNFVNDGVFNAGTGRVDFIGNPSTIRGGTVTTFYNLSVDFANVVGAAVLAVDATPGAFSVLATWTNNETGGFSSGSASTVTFGGAPATVAGSQTTEFHHVTIAAASSLAITSTGTTLRVRGTLTNSGNGLVAAGHTVEFTGTNGQIAGSAITFNKLSVVGTLTLDSGDDVRVSDSATGFAVPAGGSFTMSGSATLRLGTAGTAGKATVNGTMSASGATPRITDMGARYAFDIGGGTISVAITALAFDRCDANGLRVLAGSSTAIDLDGISFTNGVAGAGGTKYINLLYASLVPGTFPSFNGCSFDANCEFNVHTQTGAAVQDNAINMTGFSGAKGDASYEDDGGPDAVGGASGPPPETTGSIRWNVFVWTNTTGDQLWSNPGNWSPSGPPPSTATVTIPDTTVIGYPVLNVTATIGALTILTNGQLFTNDPVPPPAGPFNTSLTITGTLNLQTGASLDFSGSGLLTVSGAVDNDGTIVFSGSGTFSAGGGIDSSGTLTQSGGTLAVTGNLVNSGSLTLSGTDTVSGNFSNTGTFTAGAGTVRLTGGGNTIAGASGASSFFNLTVPAGGSYSATNALGVTGALDVDGTLNFESSVSMGTSFDAAAGTIGYTGSGAQTVVIPPGGAYNNLRIAKSGGTATLAGSIVVNCDFRIDSGTFDAGAATIRIACDFTNSGTFVASTSTVDFVGASSQVRGSSTTTFNHIAIDLANAFASSSLAVNTTNAGNKIKVAGNWTNNDTFNGSTPLASIVEFTGGASQILGSQVTRFHHLTVAAAAVLEVTSATVSRVEVTANFTHDGTWTPGNDTVRFVAASGALAGTAAATFYKLEVTGTLLLDGTDSLTVQGDGASCVTVVSGGTLNLTATSLLRLGTTGPVAGVVQVNGSFLASGTPVVTDAGGGVPNRYAFTVGSVGNPGTVAISGLVFNRSDANGLNITANAGAGNDVDGVSFTNGTSGPGTYYLQLMRSPIAAGTYTFSGCSFDGTTTFNVRCALAISNGAIAMRGFGGVGAGDQYDDDPQDIDPPIDDSDGSILWPETRFTNGNGTALWNDPLNWDSGLVPGLNDRCVIDPDFFTIVTATVTLNISTTIAGLVIGEGGVGTASVTLVGDGGARNLIVSGNVRVEPDGPDADGAPAVLDFQSTGVLQANASVDNDGRIENTNGALVPLPVFDLRSGLDNSGTILLTNFRAAGNNLDGPVVNSGTITMGDEDLSVSGSWSNSGTFNSGTGRILLDGAGTQAITGPISFYNLSVSGTDARASGSVTVSNTLAVSGTLKILTRATFTLSRALGNLGTPAFPPYPHFVSGTLEIQAGSGGNKTTVLLGNYQQLVIDGTIRIAFPGGATFNPAVGGYVHFTRSGAAGGYSIWIRDGATADLEFTKFEYLYTRSANSNETTEATVESGLAFTNGLAGIPYMFVLWFDNAVDGGAPPNNRYPRYLYFLTDDADSFNGLGGDVQHLSKLRFENGGGLAGLHNVEKRAPGNTIRPINGAGAVYGEPFDMDGRLDDNVTPDPDPRNTGVDQIEFSQSPTAVDLVALSARAYDAAVLVEWETGQEIDNLGFNVYRSRFPDRDFIQVNPALILGLGDSETGGRYYFLDRSVENGIRYYYLVEDVDDRGTRTLHGPVDAVPAAGLGEPLLDDSLYVNHGSTDEGPGTVPLSDPSEPPPATGNGTPLIAEKLLGIDLAAAGIRLISWDETGAVLEILPPEATFSEEVWGGVRRTRIEMRGYASTSAEGKPLVPAKRVLLVTPEIERASVEILEADSRVFPIFRPVFAPPATRLYSPPAGTPPPAVSGQPAGAGDTEEKEGRDRLMADLIEARRELLAAIKRRKAELLEARREALEEMLGGSPGRPDAAGDAPPSSSPSSGALPARPAAPVDGALFPGSLVDLERLIRYAGRQLLPLEIHPVQVQGGRADVYRRILVRIDFIGAAGPGPGGEPGGEGLVDTLVQRWLSSNPSALKVKVVHDGLYRLTRDDLARAGLDVSADPRTIRMFHLGREIAMRVSGEADGVFGAGDAVYFYGTKNPWRTIDNPEATRYTDENVYWLTAGSGFGKRMEDAWVTPGPGILAPRAEGDGVLHLEENASIFTRIENGEGRDFWFHPAPLYNTAGGSHPWSRRTFVLPTPDLAGTPHTARLIVALAGVTDFFAHPDHRVLVSVNGALVGELMWDGRQAHRATFEIPSGLLSAGDNAVELRLPADLPEVANDYVFVNYFSLAYRRLLVARADAVSFPGEGPGEYAATGFAPGPVYGLDATDPSFPRWLRGMELAGGTVRWNDRAAGSGALYHLAGEGALLSPLAIETNAPSDWRTQANRADRIAIAHPTLVSGVQTLADFRASQGLATAVVDVTDLFDEFTGGLPDPLAIRGFLAHVRGGWTAPAPRFVVLVGDGSQDSHNYRFAVPDYVPTKLMAMEHVLSASDNWYAAVEGEDELPDLALGRLPVRSEDELMAVVAKILAHETGPAAPWQREVSLVADNDDAAYDFSRATRGFATLFDPAYSVEELYLGPLSVAEVRSRVLAAFDGGRILVAYMGHGNATQWANEYVFGAASVPTLAPSGRNGLVTAMGCMNGMFHLPQLTSLGEACVRTPDRGGMAFWGSTALVEAAPQEDVYRELVRILFDEGGRTIGEAVTEAKVIAWSAGGSQTDVVRSWVLFGDPATRLK